MRIFKDRGLRKISRVRKEEVMDQERFLHAALIAFVITAMILLFAWKFSTSKVGEFSESFKQLKSAVEQVK